MAVLRGPEHRFELANPGYRRLIGKIPLARWHTTTFLAALRLDDRHQAVEEFIEQIDRLLG